jgi:hypothetical protein
MQGEKREPIDNEGVLLRKENPTQVKAAAL